MKERFLESKELNESSKTNNTMKIAFAASAGGHLAQVEKIFTKEVIGNNKAIYLTERNPKTEIIPNVYFFKSLDYNPFPYLPALLKCIRIFKKEKVKLVITTGAQIGLVGVIAGKIVGAKTIFIDIPTPCPFHSASKVHL